MIHTRRGFIGSILAACSAPAIVRADALMNIRPLHAGIEISGTSIASRYFDNLERSMRRANLVWSEMIVGDIATLPGISGQFIVVGHTEGSLIEVCKPIFAPLKLTI